LSATQAQVIALKNDGTIVGWGFSPYMIPENLTHITDLSVYDSHVFVLQNQSNEPTAIIKPQCFGIVHKTVILDGRGSYDPNHSSLVYEWVLLEKPLLSKANIHHENSPVAFFIPDQPGSYTFGLTVDNNEVSSDQASAKITVVSRKAAPIFVSQKNHYNHNDTPIQLHRNHSRY
jgi:hypothetical protein